MDNNNKFNNISIVSFILACFSFLMLIAFYFKIHLYQILPIPLGLIDSSLKVEGYFLFLSLIIGLILGIISLLKIKETKEKGKLFAITPILLIIFIIIFFSNSYFKSNRKEKEPNYIISYKTLIARSEIFNVHGTPEFYSDSCDKINVINSINEIKKVSTEVKFFCDNNGYIITAKLYESVNNNDYYCLDDFVSPSIKLITAIQNKSIVDSRSRCVQE